MSNKIRSKAGIDCIKFLSKFYSDDLIVLRNHKEIIDGSFRDIDLFLNTKKSKLIGIFDFENISDEYHFLISNIRRKNFLQLKIFSVISNEVFVIDIRDKLEWKGIPYFINGKCNEDLNYSNENGINFFSEKDQLLLAICKCITQTGSIKSKYFKNVKEEDLSIDFINLFGYNYIKILGTSKLLRFLTLTFITKGKYLKGSFVWLFMLIKYSCFKKGIFIELVGPDGSGKTSLSELLVKKKLFFAKSKYFHGRVPILPRISDLISFKRRAPERLIPDSEMQLNIKNSLNNRKFTILHILYYSIDALLSRIFLFFWLRRDLIIVVDRSPYDIYARTDYSNIQLFLKKFYIFCHPKPSKRLLLKADPKIINQRKNELTVNEIMLQYEAYEKNLSSKNYQIIDTGSGIDESFNQTVLCLITKQNY